VSVDVRFICSLRNGTAARQQNGSLQHAHPPRESPTLAFGWHWSGVQFLSHDEQFRRLQCRACFIGSQAEDSLLYPAVLSRAGIIRLICAVQEGEVLTPRVARSDLHAKRSKRPPTQPSAMT
jgi:hypothetical protein